MKKAILFAVFVPGLSAVVFAQTNAPKVRSHAVAAPARNEARVSAAPQAEVVTSTPATAPAEATRKNSAAGTTVSAAPQTGVESDAPATPPPPKVRSRRQGTDATAR